MNSLKILGQEKVGNFEFTGIEGGFGEGKKSMLVKDIAEIHKRSSKVINQAINMNIKRFRAGVDILDLKASIVPTTSIFYQNVVIPSYSRS